MNNIDKLLGKLGFDELNKYQKQVIGDGFLDKGNHVVSLPMGSGKSLLAYIKLMENSGLHLYVAPSRAIAYQKKEDLSEIFDNVSLVMGGYRRDDVDPNIRVITPEKLMIDMIEKKISFDDMGVVIFDEAHIITDRSRGPGIELLATTLNKYTNKTQLGRSEILLMSGTIYNHEELAMWIGGRAYHIAEEEEGRKCYIADVRPRGIILEDPKSGDEIYMLNDTEYAVTSVVRRYYEKTDKRVLVVCETKPMVNAYYQEMEQKTGLNGIYIHHSELIESYKKKVEEKLVGYDYRVVFSTTTLAMGVDFTFDTVILTFDRLHDDIYDWKGDNQDEIDNSMILTLQQISRRSGHKPGVVSEGITVGKTTEESVEIYENAYEKTPPVTSKLYLTKGLMTMQLWFVYLIALGVVKTVADLFDFVNDTFFIRNGGDMDVLYPTIREFMLNPWVGLSSDAFDLEKIGINEILNNELMQDQVDIRVSECLVNLAKKGWSPGLLFNFIWYTFDNFRSFKITDDEILGNLIKPDLELVVEMRDLSGYKKKIYNDKYQAFFESLKMVANLSDDTKFGKPKHEDKRIYYRILNLIDLVNSCINDKMINTFTGSGDKEQVINDFKSDRRTRLIMRMKLDDLIERITID